MPIVFILIGVAIVVGFLVVGGVAVFLMRDQPPEEDAQDDSEPYL
jgi:flagellar basal body-associated protein FliL